MPLEQFKLWKSPDKRLIQYDDTIYKVHIEYICTKELPNIPCPSETAHDEIENVIKACIYSAETQSKLNIQTSHFKMRCVLKEWQAGKKLMFLQNGIEVKAHSHMLLIKVEPLDRKYVTSLSPPRKKTHIEDEESFQKDTRKIQRLSDSHSNTDTVNVTDNERSDKKKERQATHEPRTQSFNSSTEQFPLQHFQGLSEHKEMDSSSRSFRLKEVCRDKRNVSSCKRKILLDMYGGKKKRKRKKYKRNDSPKKHDMHMDLGRETLSSCSKFQSSICDLHVDESSYQSKNENLDISVDDDCDKVENGQSRKGIISTALSVLVTPVKKLFGK